MTVSFQTYGHPGPPAPRSLPFPDTSRLSLPLPQSPILFLCISLLRNPLPCDAFGSTELIGPPPLGVPSSSPARTCNPQAPRTAPARGGDPVRRRQRNTSTAIVRQMEVQATAGCASAGSCRVGGSIDSPSSWWRGMRRGGRPGMRCSGPLFPNLEQRCQNWLGLCPRACALPRGRRRMTGRRGLKSSTPVHTGSCFSYRRP